MKAVILISGFSSQMRPLTLTMPLPLLDFCNTPFVRHQLQALKDAGVTEVIFCVRERSSTDSWDQSIKQIEADLGIKITTRREPAELGTAGPLKHAEDLITDDGTSDAPFFLVNSDVLCSYPLRDLLHTHMKHGKECTMLVTRTEKPSNYGVVVCDDRTGRVQHFVEKPETFVSDLINAGVYVFSPSFLARIPAGEKVSMNQVLPKMALEEQVQSHLLTGYWVKIIDCKSFMDAVSPHLELTRFMNKSRLSKRVSSSAGLEGEAEYEVQGNVIIHPSAKSHTLISGSLIGWTSQIGKWCQVQDSVFGESVEVFDSLLVCGATVLPNKELKTNIRTPQIVI